MLLTGYDLSTFLSYTLPKGRAHFIQSRDDVLKKVKAHEVSIFECVGKIHAQIRRGLKLVQKEKST